MGPLGPQTVSELELLACLSIESEIAERFGGVEVGAGLEERTGVTENPPLDGDGFRDQSSDVEGQAFCGGGSASRSA